MITSTHHYPRGSLAHGPWLIHLTPARAGWSWCSLRVLELAPGQVYDLETAAEEMVVVPLSGSCSIEGDGIRLDLLGRATVFEAVSDVAYLPPQATVALRSAGGGRFALAGSFAQQARPIRRFPAMDIPVELRGAGSCSRQINRLFMPDGCEADRLLVCEVLTPAGNWSSYPPHKHDEDRPGETVLEEIYYFEVASVRSRHAESAVTAEEARGVAFQRVYGTRERPIDVLAEVHSGDVVLVPHGWHGPSMAVPGYDLYYLNVMAGPGPRGWHVSFDPAHQWVAETWATQSIDPRLPMTRSPTTFNDLTPEAGTP